MKNFTFNKWSFPGNTELRSKVSVADYPADLKSLLEMDSISAKTKLDAFVAAGSIPFTAYLEFTLALLNIETTEGVKLNNITPEIKEFVDETKKFLAESASDTKTEKYSVFLDLFYLRYLGIIHGDNNNNLSHIQKVLIGAVIWPRAWGDCFRLCEIISLFVEDAWEKELEILKSLIER